MATLPYLPFEIIEEIVSNLPLQDLCVCMLVCKQWKELLTSEQFCKGYVHKHYDFDDEEEPTGHLALWQERDSRCLLGFNWLDGRDESRRFVFSDPPKRWKCGIVHLAKYTLESHEELKYKDFFKAVRILMKIQKAAEEMELDCTVFGNESGGNVEVCLFPWSKETLPTAEDVVNLFRFNPEIVAHCEMWEDADIYTGCGEEDQDVVDNRTGGRFIIESYGDDKTKAITFVKWLDENGTWPDSC